MGLFFYIVNNNICIGNLLNEVNKVHGRRHDNDTTVTVWF